MQIFGINLTKTKYHNFLNKIKSELVTSPLTPLLTGEGGIQDIIFTPNPEILLNTLKDQEFKQLINKATYLTPDGIGLYIGFQILENKKSLFIETLLIPYYFFNLFFRRKYLYKKYGDRICGSDLTSELVNFAQEKNIKITILDPYYPKDLAKVESQKKFVYNLNMKFPKLDFDYFIYKNEDKNRIIEKIKKSNSQILFSTLGMKSQEKSVIEIMSVAKNLKLGLGVGSSFDYFTGFQKRAPKIWRMLGLEWLYRLLTGPKKIKRLKRLYNAIFVFLYKVLTEKHETQNNNNLSN